MVTAAQHQQAGELEDLFGSAKALQLAEQELQTKLRTRGIFFGEQDKLIPTYASAFLTSQEQIQRWAEQSELAIAAAEYQASHLVAEWSSCDTISMDADLIEILYAYPGYERTCVISRPDAIPVGNDLKFVELNCDSPAMMMFLDIVTQCLLELDAFAPIRAKTQATMASDKLLDTLLDCYREYGGKHNPPNIAITDWEGQKTRFEHQRLREHFEKRGYPTVICDPRAFQQVGNELHVNGRRIDLVYRRALASEMIERRRQIMPLLTAYRDGQVCMVNPLRAYVASAKSLLTSITEEALPPELKSAAQYIPHTVLLDNVRVREAVAQAPGQWVLKRSEGHGGANVVLPYVASDQVRRDALVAAGREVWIAQEYVAVPQLAVPTNEGGEAITWARKFYNWNPFVFGGRYAGGLCRVSSTPLINIQQGGGLLATVAT